MEYGPLCDKKPVMMVFTIPFVDTTLSLPVIFQTIPITDLKIDLFRGRNTKKVKIPPHFNKPGVIFSMRYNKKTRGLRRTKNSSSFPHSIILDIGTMKHIVGVKLSRTIEITSRALSQDTIDEIVGYIVDMLKKTRKDLEHIYTLKGEECKIKINEYISKYMGDMNHSEALKIFDVLDINKSVQYKGTLDTKASLTELVNYNFRLGRAINMVKFPQLISQGTDFYCKRCVLSSPTISVKYFFTKKRNGRTSKSKMTFTIRANGSVMFSGPSFNLMVPVYNSFMKRYFEIKNKVSTSQILKLTIKCTNYEHTMDLDTIAIEEKRSRHFVSELMSGKLSLIKRKPLCKKEELQLILSDLPRSFMTELISESDVTLITDGDNEFHPASSTQ
uniref:Transcription factor TFIID n=1 Tax=Pithovirus LCDPAC01 TaxID=2506600 RepID=A0A481YNI8_9VIRU|nr:MAG: transcription factor TFIID [Pithovirus LCDPAC01]